MKKSFWNIKSGIATFSIITNKPGRRSNPIPDKPAEDEEEEAKPGKDEPKRKKKKRAYEVTC